MRTVAEIDWSLKRAAERLTFNRAIDDQTSADIERSVIDRLLDERNATTAKEAKNA